MYKLIDILREVGAYKVDVDKETIAKFIKDNGITRKSTAEGSLYIINPTYYRIAQHMGWLDDLFPKETEEEIYKKIENFIRDNNLKKPIDLKNAKRSYFNKAKTYNLIDKLFPKESEEELYKKIAKFIEDNNITTFASYKDNNSLRVANPYYFRVVGKKNWSKKLFPLNAKQLQASKKQTRSRKFTSAQKDRFLALGNKIKNLIKIPVGDSIEAEIDFLQALDDLKGVQKQFFQTYNLLFPGENLESEYLAKLKEVLGELISRVTNRTELKDLFPTVLSKILGHDLAYPENRWWKELTAHFIPLGNAYKRMVYVFEFPDGTAYVGLTYDEQKRKGAHLGQDKSPVFKHIQKTGLYPKFYRLTRNDDGKIIKTEDLTYIEAADAQKLEYDALEEYKDDGWKVHNIAPAGSLGGSAGAQAISIDKFNRFVKDRSNDIESFKLISQGRHIKDMFKNLPKEEQVEIYNRIKTIIKKEGIKNNEGLKKFYRGAHNLIQDMGWGEILFGTKSTHDAPVKAAESFLAEPNNLDKDQLKLITKRTHEQIKNPEQEKIYLTKVKGIIDKYNLKRPDDINNLTGNDNFTWGLSNHDRKNKIAHDKSIVAIEKAKKENPDKDPEIEVVPLNQWKDIIWPDGYPGRRSGARGKTSINESIVNREVLNCIIKRLINYNK